MLKAAEWNTKGIYVLKEALEIVASGRQGLGKGGWGMILLLFF